MARGRVLVVDDDVLIRLLLATMLGADGWDVCEAGDLAAAEAVLSGEDAPAVVVLDENLPDGSGIDFAQRVRAHAAQAHVVLYSGMTFDAPPDGFDAVVHKGGAPGALVEHLASV